MGSFSRVTKLFAGAVAVAVIGAGMFYAIDRRGSRVKRGLPDLVPVGLVLVGSGTNFTQQLTVQNQGAQNVTLPAVSAHVHLVDPVTHMDNNIGCGGPWRPSLTTSTVVIPGGSLSVLAKERMIPGYTLQAIVACVAKEPSVWMVEVDDNHAVTESDEVNNIKFFPNQ